jgi:hypothetical protein
VLNPFGVHSIGVQWCAGFHPVATSSYNASIVKIYNSTSSLVRFGLKKIFSSILKNALAYYSAGVVAANS